MQHSPGTREVQPYTDPDPTPPHGTVRQPTSLDVIIDGLPPTDGSFWHMKGDLIEQTWTPIIGPTAMLLARRLCTVTGRHDVDQLARSLGVGVKRMLSALARLERNGLVKTEHDGDGTLDVRIYDLWPAAPTRKLRRCEAVTA